MWDRLDRDGSRLELFKSCGYGGFDLVIASDCLFFKARGGGNEVGGRGGGGRLLQAGRLFVRDNRFLYIIMCMYVCMYAWSHI